MRTFAAIAFYKNNQEILLKYIKLRVSFDEKEHKRAQASKQVNAYTRSKQFQQ